MKKEGECGRADDATHKTAWSQLSALSVRSSAKSANDLRKTVMKAGGDLAT